MMRLMALVMVYALLLSLSAWIMFFMRDSLPGFVRPNSPDAHPDSRDPYERIFRGGKPTPNTPPHPEPSRAFGSI